MSKIALQQAPAETFPVPDRPANDARPSESLVALTQDELLRETLTAVAPEHILSFATDEADLADHLRAEPAGVAFLDSAALKVPAAELTERLRAQFPDLVLVVAGGPEDQAALSHQVARGIVYRFLHKPVSAQRVKLFVDAAWRRHDVEHAATGTFAAVKLESPFRSYLARHAPWLGLSALALILAGGLTFVLRHASAKHAAVQVASASAAESASLLARADAALARGALISPPGESAADLYRQVLRRDAGNSSAREGLQRVAEGLLTSAEQALLADHIDQSRELTEAARTIDPGNVRIAFLTAQIAKQSGGEPLDATGGGAASAPKGLAGRALSGVRSTSPSRAPSPPVAAADAAGVGGRVSGFLKQADLRMRSGALLAPAQNNAKFFLDAAAALAPDDPAVHKAQRALLDRLLAEAQSAARGGDISAGERWAQAAGDAGARSEDLAAVRRSLQDARAAAASGTIVRLADLFNQRLAQGRLLTPPTDSARFYLARMESADATNPSTVVARTALAGRLLDQARNALAGHDLGSAEAWLAEARVVGANAGDAGAVEQAIAASRNAAPPESILPETTLKKLHYVEPDYPAVAEQLGRSGIVEMQFTVEPDGSVGDIQVTHANPRRMFDDAAIAAVRQWRYEPVLRNGRAVAQRVTLRVVFKP